MSQAAELIELDRYPLRDLASEAGAALLADLRKSLAERGVAILPGFVRPEALRRMSDEVEVPRYVALFGFDTAPGQKSSELLKRVRYGRVEARPRAARGGSG